MRNAHVTENLRFAGIVVALLILTPVLYAGTFVIAGPDAYGYTGAPATYSPRDISSSGTIVTLADDSVSGALAIGFGFNFYGTTYTDVYLSSNGFLTFLAGSSNGCCTGQALPNSANPNGLIAGWWEDMNPAAGGNIRYLTQGAPGAREMIVGVYGVHHYSTGNPGSLEYILHEGSNNIELQYISVLTDGGTHSIGIENQDGTVGLQAYHGTADTFGQQAYLFTAPDGAAPGIPEPSTVSLLALSLAALGFLSRRK